MKHRAQAGGGLPHGRAHARRQRGLLLLLLLLTAASLAWSERNPAWGLRSWYLLWGLGVASALVSLAWVCGGERRGRRALVAGLLLALGQLRSLELLLMFLAWSIGGFAP